MTFAAHRIDGPAVHASRPSRPRKLTPAQVLNQRNALWLFAVTVGLHCPVLGVVRVHSTAELARLFNVSRQTILNGIASARAARALVEEVASGD